MVRGFGELSSLRQASHWHTARPAQREPATVIDAEPAELPKREG
jgi:hypothetical protein